MKLFFANSTKRIYPVYDGSQVDFYDIYCARNENVCWQAVLYNDTDFPVSVSVKTDSELVHRIRLEQLITGQYHTVDTEASELDGVGILPGLMPEPLIDEDSVIIPPYTNRAFWVNTYIPKDFPAGACETIFTAQCCRLGDEANSYSLSSAIDINVADFTVENKKTINCLHWFYCDSISDYYKVEPFSEEFWPICEKYMLNYSEHGNTMIYLPLFTPPLDGVKRPNQLLGVSKSDKNTYQFDFSLADRYVDLANKCGIYDFEFVHLFTQWGCKHPIRIYFDPKDEESVIFDPESSAVGAEYREFLSQFMPAVKAWAEKRGVFGNLYFHMSDEPHGEEAMASYKEARSMMREIAPWMRIMDALSDVNIAIKAGVDMPISSVHSANDFIERNIPHWVYYCCGPKGRNINRFMDTPLYKIRMLGAAMYKLNALGFLQWGYNYWYKIGTRKMIDVYEDTCAGTWPGIPMGDAFEVYPSVDGPVDSLRWEVFRELLGDVDLFNAFDGDIKDDLLDGIKDYREFPREEGFIHRIRKALLAELVP